MQKTYLILLFQVRIFYIHLTQLRDSQFYTLEYSFVGIPPSLVACGSISSAVNSLLQQYAPECRKTLANLTGIEQVGL